MNSPRAFYSFFQNSIYKRQKHRPSYRPTFRENYFHPALKNGLIEMTIPETPGSKQADPYWPSGMIPSKSMYSNGWSSTTTASLLLYVVQP